MREEDFIDGLGRLYIEDVNTGCWNWQKGKTAKDGYGKVNIDSNNYYDKSTPYTTHRLMYILHNRSDIPEGMCVCHKCDNPSCVNPEHLFLGTYKDNAQDMVNKGRQRKSNSVTKRNKLKRKKRKYNRPWAA